jgi:hypothetical protein
MHHSDRFYLSWEELERMADVTPEAGRLYTDVLRQAVLAHLAGVFITWTDWCGMTTLDRGAMAAGRLEADRIRRGT